MSRLVISFLRRNHASGLCRVVVIAMSLHTLCSVPSVASEPLMGTKLDGASNEPEPLDGLVSSWSAMIAKLQSLLPDMPVALGPVIVSTRAKCLATMDGSVDCQTAARSACAREGFGSGIDLDQSTARICRGTSMADGEAPGSVACKQKTWITRAACW